VDKQDKKEIEKLKIIKKRISLLVNEIKDAGLSERDIYILKDYFDCELIPGTFWG